MRKGAERHESMVTGFCMSDMAVVRVPVNAPNDTSPSFLSEKRSPRAPIAVSQNAFFQ